MRLEVKANTPDECKRGHKGRMRLNNKGYWVCRVCHEASNARYRKAEREREKHAYNVLRNAI